MCSCDKEPSGNNTGLTNSGPSVKIMSFNVKTPSTEPEEVFHKWENRRDACCAMINYHRPMLLGVQECKLPQREYLLSKCKGYAVVGRSRDNTSDGQQTAIFYLRDSISVLDWDTFWLTETPDQMSKLEGGALYRTATWVKAQHKSSGKFFYHLNTHLEHSSNAYRTIEMPILLGYIEKNFEDYPIVMTADWNQSDEHELFNEMYKTFKNSRFIAPLTDKGATYNNFGGETSFLRIDHVFYRGFSACSRFGVDRQTWAGHAYLSDHYPVYAILHF